MISISHAIGFFFNRRRPLYVRKNKTLHVLIKGLKVKAYEENKKRRKYQIVLLGVRLCSDYLLQIFWVLVKNILFSLLIPHF